MSKSNFKKNIDEVSTIISYYAVKTSLYFQKAENLYNFKHKKNFSHFHDGNET